MLPKCIKQQNYSLMVTNMERDAKIEKTGLSIPLQFQSLSQLRTQSPLTAGRAEFF